VNDVAVLNVARMGDEPKRLSEIGQLLNRVDVPNRQYVTRKLVKAGLIETEGSSSRKETRYRPTETGHSITEACAALRAATMPPMLEVLEGWVEQSEAAGSHLELVSSLYTQDAQVAITRRGQP
jgi:predicted MarR family transcription regulator